MVLREKKIMVHFAIFVSQTQRDFFTKSENTYPNLPFAIRPVAHSEDLSVPKPLVTFLNHWQNLKKVLVSVKIKTNQTLAVHTR